ncbi:MAG TPA: glycosyltransferase family 39 protein [bacterium]
MRQIAPFDVWLQWWGSPAVYQQSPLYPYVLAAMLAVTGNMLVVHFLHLIAGFLLCVSIGALAGEVSQDRTVGLAAFVLSGLYGPFYAYSWHLLHDAPSWLVLSTFALLLIRWWRAWSIDGVPSRRLSVLLGLALGLGVLADEVFYLLTLVTALAAGLAARRRRDVRPVIPVFAAFVLCVSPLVARNLLVGAPLHATSTRFAETFIEYNAPGATGTDLVIPREMGPILARSGGAAVPVVIETLASYEGASGAWAAKMARKVLALADPYESPDNVNLYYMALLSPLVRWGVPHWLIIVPGVLGLVLSLARRDEAWSLFLVLFLCVAAGVMLVGPSSRYRQILCVFWIPWAAWYVGSMLRSARAPRLAGLALIPVGWILCVGTAPHRSPGRIYRQSEFVVAADIYEARGEHDKARAQLLLFEELQQPGRGD